jgi:cell division protein FtsB
VKKDDDEFPDIGTKLQILTLKRENMKLQKRITKLEAENATLQNRIKVLKKEPKQTVKIVHFSKK